MAHPVTNLAEKIGKIIGEEVSDAAWRGLCLNRAKTVSFDSVTQVWSDLGSIDTSAVAIDTWKWEKKLEHVKLNIVETTVYRSALNKADKVFINLNAK